MEENISHMASLGNANNSKNSEKKRVYDSKYQRDYRNRVVRKEVIFSITEFEAIQKHALAHDHNVAEHIRKCTLSYINETVLVSSKADLQNLRYELNRIGNNINQLAYKVNRDGKDVFNARYFHDLMKDLDITIKNYASKTIDQEMIIQAVIQSRPILKKIESLLRV